VITDTDTGKTGGNTAATKPPADEGAALKAAQGEIAEEERSASSFGAGFGDSESNDFTDPTLADAVQNLEGADVEASVGGLSTQTPVFEPDNVKKDSDVDMKLLDILYKVTGGPELSADDQRAGIRRTGIGPGCYPGEIGEGLRAQCWYLETQTCVANYYNNIVDCGLPEVYNAGRSKRSKDQFDVTEVAAKLGIESNLPPPFTSLSSVKRQKDCETIQHDILKRCLAFIPGICNCRDSTFEVCQGTDCGRSDPDKKVPIAKSANPASTVVGKLGGDGLRGEKGAKLQSVEVSGSAYGVPIPHVFGRFVVGGNIIYMSALRDTSYTRVRGSTNASSPGYVEPVNTRNFDIAIGLAAGEINAVVRVWLEETLVYTGALVVGSSGRVVTPIQPSLDVGYYTGSGSDTSALAYDLPTFTLYNGREDQTRNARMYTANTDVPAYRGLAYLFIENMNVALLNSKFPGFRIEVYSGQGDISVPYETVTNSVGDDVNDADGLYLYADTNTDTLFYSGGGLLRRAGYVSLVSKPAISVDGVSVGGNTYLTRSNAVVVQDGLSGRLPTAVYDSIAARVESAFGSVDAGVGHDVSGWSSFGRVADTLTSYVDGAAVETILFGSAGGDLALLRFDPANRRTTRGGITTLAGQRVQTVISGTRTNTLTGLTEEGWYVLSLSTPSTQINVWWLSIQTIQDGRVPASAATVHALPPISSASFANKTNSLSVSHFLRLDGTSDVVLILSSTDGWHAIRYNYKTGVVWNASLPTPAGIVSSNQRRLRYGADDYMYLTISAAVRVNLRNGTVQVRQVSLPLVTGGQYYDPSSESVTYVAGGRILRVAPYRAAARTVSLAYIFREVWRRGGSDATRLSLHSSLDDVYVVGYALLESEPLRSLFETLIDIFDLRVYANSGAIHVEPGLLTTAVRMVDAERIQLQSEVSADLTHKSLEEVVGGVALTTYDQTSPLEPTTTRHSGSGDGGVVGTVTRVYTIDANLTTTSAQARVLAGDIYARLTRDDEEVRLTLPPYYASITPRDNIAVRIHDEILRLGRVVSVVENAGGYTTLIVATQPVASLDLSAVLTPTTFFTPAPTRADSVVLSIPAILDTHYTSTDNVLATAPFYAGVLSVAADIPSTQVELTPRAYTRTLVDVVPRGGGTYISNPVSKSLLSGAVLQAAEGVTDPATFDTRSSLVVIFDRTGADSVFAVSDEFDLLQDIKRNLLVVGRELLQFSTWIVASDGRTYTFTGLLRGRRGTEIYSGATQVGDRVYVYTEDTFARVEVPVQSVDTAPLLTAAGYVLPRRNAVRPVGAEYLEPLFPGYPQAARLWAPGSVKRYDATHTATATNWGIYLNWKTRELRYTDTIRHALSTTLYTSLYRLLIFIAEPSLAQVEEFLYGRRDLGDAIKYDTGVVNDTAFSGYRHQSPPLSSAYQSIDTRQPLWFVLVNYRAGFDADNNLVTLPGMPYIFKTTGPHFPLV
jgi:Putative phage tail protein